MARRPRLQEALIDQLPCAPVTIEIDEGFAGQVGERDIVLSGQAVARLADHDQRFAGQHPGLDAGRRRAEELG